MFNSYDMKAFAAELKEIRISLGLSQKDVQKLTRIAPDTIRRIEKAEVVPRYDTLIMLSALYRNDLLELFKKHAISRDLFKLHKEMDYAVIAFEVKKIIAIQKEVKSLIAKAKKDKQIVSVDELTQIDLFFTGMMLYQKNFKTNSTKVLNICREALQIRHPNFIIREFMNYHYTFVELRILHLLSLAFEFTNMEIATNIDVFLYQLLYQEDMDIDRLHFVLRLCSNITYNYHLLEDFNLSLKHAEDGIQLANAYKSNYMLYQLLARKGTALYHLGDPQYAAYLTDSLNLLRIMGNAELYEVYKKAFIKIYGYKG